YDFDDAVELVASDRLARRGGDLRLVERVDLARAGLGGEHRQQARAGADIQHALAALDDLPDRLGESVRAGPVRYHEALPGELGVAFEIEIHELRCSARAPMAMANPRARLSASPRGRALRRAGARCRRRRANRPAARGPEGRRPRRWETA